MHLSNNKIVKFTGFANNQQFYSFTGWANVILLMRENNIYYLNDDLSASLICSMNNKERYTTYFQAGICIFSDDKKNNIIIDVFSKKYYNVSDP